MIIKVCGVCTRENVQELETMDVDWLGLIFWPESPRYVAQVSARGGFYPDYSSFARSAKELGGMPEEAKKEHKTLRVGVFVDGMPQNIVTRVYNFNLDLVQLHGEESPVMIDNLRRTLMPDIRQVKIIKTIFVEKPEDLEVCAEYEPVVDYFLFHTKSKAKGGSGERFDWDVIQAYKGNVPFLLSGGIGPDDVEAVRNFSHPMFAGIDVNSCFEIEPGKKDMEKVRKFVEAVKA